MPYDPLKDFTPVMKLAEGPYVLVVHPSLPAKNVHGADRARQGRARTRSTTPPRATAARSTWWARSSPRMAGAPMNHVPYKGSNQAMNDLLGGQVKVSFVGVPNALPNLANGKLRALGVSTREALRGAARRADASPRRACRATTRPSGWALLAPPGHAARDRAEAQRRDRPRSCPRRRRASSCPRRAWTSRPARRRVRRAACRRSWIAGGRWCGRPARR